MSTLSATDLLRQRYGHEHNASDPDWNATLELLLNHRSVRDYSNAPLPAGTLEALLAAAQSASTSSNLQSWSVIAVEDPGRKARLAKLSANQTFIEQAPLFLVWLADLSRLGRVAAERNLPADGLDYTEMLLVGVVDAALAAQNAVVAAESLGLGTVYIGSLRNRLLEVATELELPPRILPVFGLCVGWPDPEKPASVKPRLSQSAILHREVYNPAAEAEAVEQYNTRMTNFYNEQQMQVDGDWAHRSAQRVAGPKSLSGRDIMREVLRRFGLAIH